MAVTRVLALLEQTRQTWLTPDVVVPVTRNTWKAEKLPRMPGDCLWTIGLQANTASSRTGAFTMSAVIWYVYIGRDVIQYFVYLFSFWFLTLLFPTPLFLSDKHCFCSCLSIHYICILYLSYCMIVILSKLLNSILCYNIWFIYVMNIWGHWI